MDLYFKEYGNNGKNAFRKRQEKGEAKGRAEEKEAIARALKEQNVPVDVIAFSTGLTKEEIEAL